MQNNVPCLADRSIDRGKRQPVEALQQTEQGAVRCREDTTSAKLSVSFTAHCFLLCQCKPPC